MDGRAYGARFAHAERAPEGPVYLKWLADHGFETLDASFVNEGEGDFLTLDDVILAGTGFRSDSQSHLIQGDLHGVLATEHSWAINRGL